MHARDEKITREFEGLVVRKDLVKAVKGNAIVPSYVLEYLLGQYCATNDEASIQSGIDTVKEILQKHYVHRNQAGLVRSNIKEKGRYKVIDKIRVDLNDKKDAYEATFSNLGISKVLVDSGTVKKHPKLLVSGVWCIAEVEYEFADEGNVSPWIMASIKPIQMSGFKFEDYIEARDKFSTEEWLDLLLQSIGFDPKHFDQRSKLTQIARLIPFCERNYNLIELGPKGTGKSHIYSEFSPHGILISGGEVTIPKLFVNNSSGKIGLVGYWDVVAFDEFAGKKKRVDKSLVDIMKNYMANKSFSRGVETLGAEASMVFIGNTKHTLQHMLKHTDLFEELPDKYYDSAFIDRIHFYIPGWEVDVIRGEMFSTGYGFVVDYLAEVLRALRNRDYADRLKEYFSLSQDISTRDRDAIKKTFSGLMKIIFPSGEATESEIESILVFAIEGRKRVKDQLMRIDKTYPDVSFYYENKSDEKHWVTTAEEIKFPNSYSTNMNTSSSNDDKDSSFELPTPKATKEKLSIEEMTKSDESGLLEFKSSLRWCYRTKSVSKVVEQMVVKTVSAFANSDGGTLLIGVKDNNEILGLGVDYKCLTKIEGRDGFQLHLIGILERDMGQAFTANGIKVAFHEVSGEDICEVIVSRSPELIFIDAADPKSGAKSKKLFTRIGNASKELAQDQILTYDRSRRS